MKNKSSIFDQLEFEEEIKMNKNEKNLYKNQPNLCNSESNFKKHKNTLDYERNYNALVDKAFT